MWDDGEQEEPEELSAWEQAEKEMTNGLAAADSKGFWSVIWSIVFLFFDMGTILLTCFFGGISFNGLCFLFFLYLFSALAVLCSIGTLQKTVEPLVEEEEIPIESEKRAQLEVLLVHLKRAGNEMLIVFALGAIGLLTLFLYLERRIMGPRGNEGIGFYPTLVVSVILAISAERLIRRHMFPLVQKLVRSSRKRDTDLGDSDDDGDAWKRR